MDRFASRLGTISPWNSRKGRQRYFPLSHTCPHNLDILMYSSPKRRSNLFHAGRLHWIAVDVVSCYVLSSLQKLGGKEALSARPLESSRGRLSQCLLADKVVVAGFEDAEGCVLNRSSRKLVDPDSLELVRLGRGDYWRSCAASEAAESFCCSGGGAGFGVVLGVKTNDSIQSTLKSKHRSNCHSDPTILHTRSSSIAKPPLPIRSDTKQPLLL